MLISKSNLWVISFVSMTISLMLMGVLRQAEAAETCTDLPSSSLQLYDAKPPMVEERIVPLRDFDSNLPSEVISTHHAAMLSVSNVIVLLEVKHRVLRRDGGKFCNAPEVVRVGLGSSWQQLRLKQGADLDPCVRSALLGHGNAHIRAFNNGVAQFIDELQATFAHGLGILKQTPAASNAAAVAQWNEGLGRLIVDTKKQLLAFLRTKDDEVDDPATLSALGAACDGRVGAAGLQGI